MKYYESFVTYVIAALHADGSFTYLMDGDTDEEYRFETPGDANRMFDAVLNDYPTQDKEGPSSKLVIFKETRQIIRKERDVIRKI